LRRAKGRGGVERVGGGLQDAGVDFSPPGELALPLQDHAVLDGVTEVRQKLAGNRFGHARCIPHPMRPWQPPPARESHSGWKPDSATMRAAILRSSPMKRAKSASRSRAGSTPRSKNIRRRKSPSSTLPHTSPPTLP